MSDLFDDPGAAEQLDLNSVDGRLLLIKPLSFKDKLTTTFGEKDAIEADVHVLDGDKAGRVYRGVYIFPLVLQGQLRGNVGTGRFNLGRLTRKTPSRPGTNPAWALTTASEEDKATARKYLADKPADPAPADPWNAAAAPF